MRELTPGDVFAGYEVQRLLGRGGMGSVFLVRNTRLDRLEALKVITANGGDEFNARFASEARTAAGLDHPNIVTVYHYGFEGDQPWYTMQYLEGNDLGRAAPMDPAELATVVAAVAPALDYAHSRGVVHRDIKPANILVQRTAAGTISRVTLLDFGIARLIDSVGMTAANSFIGTLAYAAPEAITGGTPNPASDQYALACTVQELLTGRTPFVAANAVALINAHSQTPPPPISQKLPQLRSLDPVIARALAKQPGDRFPSCEAFAAALTAALGDTAAPGPDPIESTMIGPGAAIPLGGYAAPPPTGGPQTGGPQTGGPQPGGPQTGGSQPSGPGFGPNTGGQRPGYQPPTTPEPAPLQANPQSGYQYAQAPYAASGFGGPPPNGPYGAVGQPPYPTGPQPPRKSNTGLIIGIVAACLVVLGLLGGVIAWGVSKNKDRSTTVAYGSSSSTETSSTTSSYPSFSYPSYSYSTPYTYPSTPTTPAPSSRYWGMVISPEGKTVNFKNYPSGDAMLNAATEKWGFVKGSWGYVYFTTGCGAFASNGSSYQYGLGSTRSAAEQDAQSKAGAGSTSYATLCVGDSI